MKRTSNWFLGTLVIATGLAVGCGDDSGNDASDQNRGGTSNGGGSEVGGNGSTPGGTNHGGSKSSGGAGAQAGGAISMGTAYAGTSLPLEDFLPEMLSTFCRKLVTCAASTTNTEGCVDFNDPQLTANFEPTLTAVVDGRVVYDPVAAATYLRAFEAVTCEGYDAFGSSFDGDSVFAGKVALGANCTIDEECAGDLVCVGNGTCPGTCVARGGLGAACIDSAGCQGAMACGTDNRCVQRIAWGGACATGDSCATFTLCQDDGDGGMACLPWATSATGNRALGESCNSGDIGLCQAHLSCQVATDGTWPGVCVEQVSAGAACHQSVPDMCPDGQYCQVAADATAGTCTNAPTVGQACGFNGVTYVSCAGSLGCVEDLCVELRANGQTCTSDAVCASEHCKSGTCAPRLDCEAEAADA